jgi:protein arginine N-methyltransferase 1
MSIEFHRRMLADDVRHEAFRTALGRVLKPGRTVADIGAGTGVLETLRDARRFLAPGGTLIPHSIVQWAAPVSSDRFDRDFRTWRSVGHGLDWSDAERMTRNNMYVFPIEPKDLLDVAPASWDALEFAGAIESKRAGRVSWTLTTDAPIFGFALWWECTLVPGVVLSTSPLSPRTHWDQIYLPLLEPIAGVAGDIVAVDISSETGGGETGIDVRWTADQLRDGAVVARQSLDIGSGYLG